MAQLRIKFIGMVDDDGISPIVVQVHFPNLVVGDALLNFLYYTIRRCQHHLSKQK